MNPMTRLRLLGASGLASVASVGALVAIGLSTTPDATTAHSAPKPTPHVQETTHPAHHTGTGVQAHKPTSSRPYSVVFRPAPNSSSGQPRVIVVHEPAPQPTHRPEPKPTPTHTQKPTPHPTPLAKVCVGPTCITPPPLPMP